MSSLFFVRRVSRILVFTVLSVGFPYFTNVVQLLCSLSTGFNGAEINCIIAHNLGFVLILLFFFSAAF